jgi:type 1 glutamine amidotransferase
MAMKTLVFGGGQIHDWAAVQPRVVSALEAAGGFDITTAQEDLSVLEGDGLSPYAALVFHYTIGEITDAQRDGLSTWLAAGGGYVGIHSAADSFRDDPDYRNLVGGHFITHPRYREYQVSVADPDHAIMDGVDEEFMVTDEQYILDYDPRVHVLANALYKGALAPVAWTKSHGAGRVFYLALGHDGPACEHPMFAKMLVNGTRWAGASEA